MQGTTAIALALAIGACQSFVAPAPNKLRAWTTQLRDAQPEEAFAAIYVRHTQRLIFVGAKHTTRVDSQTFRLIDEAHASLHFDIVIIEGPAYSRGPNADPFTRKAEAEFDIGGFVEGGEAAAAMRGARARGIDVWGGEPDDGDIRKRVLALGFSVQDLLGFYTLRTVPQWIRERKISDGGDDRVKTLINSELEHNRARLALPANVLPNYNAWTHWYAQTNRRTFDATFDAEETGPLANGSYASNRIAEAIERVRDEFLLNIVAQHLNAGESIMVVFGESHLMVLLPALDAMLGAPCYLGANLTSMPARCSANRAGANAPGALLLAQPERAPAPLPRRQLKAY